MSISPRLVPTIRFLTLFATFVSLAACAGTGRGRPPGGGSQGGPGAPDSGSSRLIGPIARPVALLFIDWDVNSDRTVSSDELLAGISYDWDQLSGGEVSVSTFALTEWATTVLGSPDAQPSYIAFDTNLDGRLTTREFSDRFRDEFSHLDRDGSGTLTRSELVFEQPAMDRSSPRQMMRPDRGGPGSGGPGGPGGQ